MSTLAQASRSNRASVGQLVLGAIVGVVRLAILWKQIHSARRLLQAMPDNVLSDMGVSRGSIDHATSFGRGATKGR